MKFTFMYRIYLSSSMTSSAHGFFFNELMRANYLRVDESIANYLRVEKSKLSTS